MEYREALRSGTVVGNDYRIEEVIGARAFAITYLATDTRLGREVSVREYFPENVAVRHAGQALRPSHASQTNLYEWGRRAFVEEARTIAQFNHPAIVRVSRVVDANQTAYMVLDFEQGPTLEDWLGLLGRTPTQEELDAMLPPLLEALETMHRASFLHRDVAPSSISVRADGSALFTDFGGARQTFAVHSRAPTSGVDAGYSPPEFYSPDQSTYGPSSDVYALGATLYRCITGSRPHDSVERLLDDRLTSAKEAAVGGPWRPNFLEAIDWALAVRTRQRPQTVAEFGAAMLGSGPIVRPAAAAAPVPAAHAPARENVRANAPTRPAPFDEPLPAAAHAQHHRQPHQPAGVSPVWPAPVPPHGAPPQWPSHQPPAVQAGPPAERMPFARVVFGFAGRISRAQFWAVWSTSMVLTAALAALAGWVLSDATPDLSEERPWLAGIAVGGILPLWLYFSAAIKRCHDRGYNGLLSLVGLVPYVGWMWAAVDLGGFQGEAGTNEWGPDPVAGRRPPRTLALPGQPPIQLPQVPLPRMALRQWLFSYSGRVNRARYWSGTLLVSAIFYGVLAILGALAFAILYAAGIDPGQTSPGAAIAAAVVAFVLYVVFVVSALSIAVKRAHDRGYSGWIVAAMIFVSLLPFGALWMFIDLGIMEGQPGYNAYGLNPLTPPQEAGPQPYRPS